MAPPEDSDLRTFRSSLRQEAQPDFTLIIGDFSWTVHTKKLMKSTFFKKLCSGANSQPNITLNDVEPVLIGHLILWLYTGDYVDGNGTDDDNDAVSNKTGIDINIIMRNGKANRKSARQPQSSPELGSAGTAFPFTREEDETWPVPVAIHAKMYVLAERYGISELSVLTVEELTGEIGWNDTVSLPSLEYLFANPKQIENSDSSIINGKDDDKSAIWKTPTKDSDMFQLLVNTSSAASKLHETYLPDPIFQKVFCENPAFALEVLTRVAAELHDTKDQLAKLTETIETPKVKKGRKKRVASTSLEKEGG